MDGPGCVRVRGRGVRPGLRVWTQRERCPPLPNDPEGLVFPNDPSKTHTGTLGLVSAAILKSTHLVADSFILHRTSSKRCTSPCTSRRTGLTLFAWLGNGQSGLRMTSRTTMSLVYQPNKVWMLIVCCLNRPACVDHYWPVLALWKVENRSRCCKSDSPYNVAVITRCAASQEANDVISAGQECIF